MSFELGDEVRLGHIVESIDEIELAIKGFDLDSFVANHVVRIAVVKWIEIIGEASVYVSKSIKEEYPKIDWPAIKAMRNIVVHEYFGVKYDTVWEVATIHLPELKAQILKIIEERF
jgi:uncharacterized protein with HEPN domain